MGFVRASAFFGTVISSTPLSYLASTLSASMGANNAMEVCLTLEAYYRRVFV